MKSTFENREEAILNSIDGIQPAEVPPYFYTRLLARMQNELDEKKAPTFLLRPAFLTASLSVALAINIIFLFQFKGKEATQPGRSAKAPSIESFADAYNFNTSSVYE